MLLNYGVGEDCWEYPWTARRSKQSILKEISPEYSLEGLMLKLKLQYFGYLMQRMDSLKRLWCWERLKAGGEGQTTIGQGGWMASPTQWTWDGEGQGKLACCSPWGCKESDTDPYSTTEQQQLPYYVVQIVPALVIVSSLDCLLCPFNNPTVKLWIIFLGFIFFAACGMWDILPWPGMEPPPLHWEHGVLALGPPGKSLDSVCLLPLIATVLPFVRHFVLCLSIYYLKQIHYASVFYVLFSTATWYLRFHLR